MERDVTHAPAMIDNAGFIVAPPAPKRRKTAGEIAFDVGTYGGLSFLGNEALSTYIMQQTEPKGLFRKLYEPTVEFTKKLPGLNKLKYFGEGRAAYIGWATVGGMALVLPVKWVEDRKGSFVRKLDNYLHGRDTDQDPHLKAAHDEMDHAPPQSWASLWQGRAVTVGSALTMDALIGWPKAPISKLFDRPGKPNDYAGIDRLSASFARFIGKTFDKSHAANIDHVLATVKDIEKRYHIDPAIEGKLTKTVATASVMMTISGALTLLFYASSKAFARRQEARQHSGAVAHAMPLADAAQQTDTTQEAPANAGAPGTRVAAVENLSRVTTPQRQAEV